MGGLPRRFTEGEGGTRVSSARTRKAQLSSAEAIRQSSSCGRTSIRERGQRPNFRPRRGARRFVKARTNQIAVSRDSPTSNTANSFAEVVKRATESLPRVSLRAWPALGMRSLRPERRVSRAAPCRSTSRKSFCCRTIGNIATGCEAYRLVKTGSRAR